VQDHAADHLDVEMTHSERTPPGLANGRKGFWNQIIQRLTAGKKVAEFGGLRSEFVVAHGFQSRFEGGNLPDCLIERLDVTVVG
jgi:hypothetical protein